MQNAYDAKDSRSLYGIIRKVFGPQPPSVVPLKSKDGSALIKDTEGILSRRQEYFTELFCNPSVFNEDVISGLQQKEILVEMMLVQSLAGVKSAIDKVKRGKAPGLDGIPAELLQSSGDNVTSTIHKLILTVWQGKLAPQDWVDAILLSLFKGKGSKSECGDYRGISLLNSWRNV